jgi:hypothetical protein
VTAIHLRRLEEDTCRASALYPARGRQRDGTEMAASSITRRRSSGAGLRVVADLIRGALAGHVSKELRMTSKPGRVVRRGVIVVLIAWVLSG